MFLKSKSNLTGKVLPLSLLPLCITASESYAQNSSSAVLEEIIVTARKREESLQQSPVSITAFTAAEIERAGISSLDDVAALSPGLTFNSYSAGNYAIPTIRGLAQTDITNIENNVSVFLNGIYLSNKSNLDVSLLDFEQIEVVRGPQSALYGRNSFAGSINYKTTVPSDEFGGSVKVGAGSDELGTVTAVINLPLSENFNARFAANYSSFDGTITNVADTSDNLGGYDKSSFSASFDWQASDDLNIGAFVFFSDEDNDHTPIIQINNNCGQGVAGFFSVIPVPGSYCGELPAPGSADTDPRASGGQKKSTFVGLNFDYELGEGTLSGLLGYSDTDSEDLGDNDFTSQGTDYRVFNFLTFGVVGTINLDTFTGNRFDNQDTSLELRYSSNQDNDFRWAIGGFYSATDLEEVLTQSVVGDTSALAPLTGPFLAPTVAITDDPANTVDLTSGRQEITTTAVFAELAYDMSEQLTATLELRYTDESREANFPLSVGAPGPGLIEQDFDFVTPRFILDYQVSDDSLLYASVARGVKSGGFNNTNSPDLADRAYDEESNWSYELGYKTTFGGGRFQLNSSIYYVDWQDLQIQSFGQANLSIIRNLSDAEVKGAELSLLAALSDNFTAIVGYAYTDPSYGDNASTTSARRECGVPADICQLNADGEAIVSGNQLARTSENQLNLTGTYSWTMVNGWDVFIRADVVYQSEQFNAINRNSIEARTLVNGRMGIESERYSIELWGKNLTDEQYARSSLFFGVPDTFPVFSYKSILGDLRTVGITGKVNF